MIDKSTSIYACLPDDIKTQKQRKDTNLAALFNQIQDEEQGLTASDRHSDKSPGFDPKDEKVNENESDFQFTPEQQYQQHKYDLINSQIEQRRLFLDKSMNLLNDLDQKIDKIAESEHLLLPQIPLTERIKIARDRDRERSKSEFDICNKL